MVCVIILSDKGRVAFSLKKMTAISLRAFDRTLTEVDSQAYKRYTGCESYRYG
jgi:hypothetical protein